MLTTYSELMALPTFEERIRLANVVAGANGVGMDGRRFIGQQLKQSQQWKRVRNDIIIRDKGYDLGHSSRKLNSLILVHHIVPITIDDILQMRPCVFDHENLICCSLDTHNAIHYQVSDDYVRDTSPIERSPGDTTLWGRRILS